jgi:hypothetical protein
MTRYLQDSRLSYSRNHGGRAHSWSIFKGNVSAYLPNRRKGSHILIVYPGRFRPSHAGGRVALRLSSSRLMVSTSTGAQVIHTM